MFIEVRTTGKVLRWVYEKKFSEGAAVGESNKKSSGTDESVWSYESVWSIGICHIYAWGDRKSSGSVSLVILLHKLSYLVKGRGSRSPVRMNLL